MKRIDGSLLMGHEHVARALIELMQSRKTSSGPDHVLHHAPKAFDVIVTTHKTIDLVFQTQIYKLKRDMTRSHAVSAWKRNKKVAVHPCPEHL